ncbi:uncharacterized protein SPSC_02732 [Sporisorium scitamineum]|uniref:BZIP domain-containing protein n=1 Tax=Sporisorium scitamineum TaxID=49012 RepID=A0A0F7S319_9BASI|nr:hypothetical protein [Sporisorium scitamineum]CDU24103.1 uncharacterized protein SPSC_02732 [Sporisorium scitamineum]
MGRGRRPNLALEPTRALQTQRAFRQRKADHLANLEESVKILTDENAKLRKLLHLDPRSSSTLAPSPKLKSSNSPVSSTPYAAIAPAKGVPTPTSDEPVPGDVATCENCAPIQTANRQLSLAAAQVEAKVVELQQSIKALRSVLVHHGIPFPSAAEWGGGEGDVSATHRSKRFRSGEMAMPYAEQLSGIQMTSNYFNRGGSHVASPSASHQEHYLTSSRRLPPSSTPAAAGTSAWHTPSPSGILSAPTPPSAYSPRNHHAYSSYNSPAAAATAAAADDGYRRPPPPAPVARHGSSAAANGGSARPHLPPPSSMSPARQNANPPVVSTYWSTASTASSSAANSPAALARHALPPQSYVSYEGKDGYARVGGGRRYGDDGQQGQQGQGVGYEGVQSPRSRLSREQGGEEVRYGRSTSRSREGGERKGCCPTSAGGVNGGGEVKSCCPPTGRAGVTVEREAKWAVPPPLGVSFDMRGSGHREGDGVLDGQPLAEGVPVSVADADVQLDGLKKDECCFGLVKCDAEGRILI